MIAKIISDRSGVIWWVKRPNQFQSVWFMASKTFLFGTNLTGRNLNEILHEGNKRLTKFLMTLSYAILKGVVHQLRNKKGLHHGVTTGNRTWALHDL